MRIWNAGASEVNTAKRLRLDCENLVAKRIGMHEGTCFWQSGLAGSGDGDAACGAPRDGCARGKLNNGRAARIEIKEANEVRIGDKNSRRARAKIEDEAEVEGKTRTGVGGTSDEESG